MHKLVVHFDDDPFITGLSAGILRQHDITVVQRIRSEHVFEILRRFNPGVVLLEIEMQGSQGLDLLAAMREYNPIMQIIVFTRRLSSRLMLSALDHGAADFLTKPLESNDLLVESVHAGFRRLDRWQSQYAALTKSEKKDDQAVRFDQAQGHSLLTRQSDSSTA